MPEMIMLRDYVLASTQGLSVRFTKNISVYVPPELVSEAMEKGAVPSDGKGVAFEEEKPVEVPVGSEREALVAEAVRELVAKNDADDFGANGSPKVQSVKRELGFDVDRDEVQAAWKQVRVEA
jgi:hypothetical protein